MILIVALDRCNKYGGKYLVYHKQKTKITIRIKIKTRYTQKHIAICAGVTVCIYRNIHTNTCTQRNPIQTRLQSDAYMHINALTGPHIPKSMQLYKYSGAPHARV